MKRCRNYEVRLRKIFLYKSTKLSNFNDEIVELSVVELMARKVEINFVVDSDFLASDSTCLQPIFGYCILPCKNTSMTYVTYFRRNALRSRPQIFPTIRLQFFDHWNTLHVNSKSIISA